MNLELYRHFLKLIRSGKRLSTVFDRGLKDLEITLTQGEVLLALIEVGKIRQIDLADQIYVNRATLIPMVERLEMQGWVKKQANPDDQRSYFVVLTEAGKRQTARVRNEMNRIAGKLGQGLPAARMDELALGLDKILKNLEEKEEEHTP